MTDPTIIEAASEAMCNAADLSSFWNDGDEAWRVATAVLAAVTPLILANERKEIAEQARRYAGHYKEGSDGRNTFIMLAEWIEARAIKEQP